MKVLILTPIPFWHPGTGELIAELRARDFSVRVIDVFLGVGLDENNAKFDLLPSVQMPFLRRVILKLFRKKLLGKHLRKDEIVDIHFVEPAYGQLADVVSGESKGLIATLFGSDLFRTTEEEKRRQSPVFENADIINLSKNMIPLVDESFPGQSEKYRINQYGSKRLDIVVEKLTKREEIRSKYGIRKDQIVVTCGYNGKREQQHLQMFDALKGLPLVTKSKLKLLVPLTYGLRNAGPEYLPQIENALEESGIEFQVLVERLSDEEIAETKVVSDITLNLQTTDALASSIKEAMVSGDVMVLGEWLPYDVYEELGIHFVPTSVEGLSNMLRKVLEDFEGHRSKSRKNQKEILAFCSWDVLIEDWISTYKELELD